MKQSTLFGIMLMNLGFAAGYVIYSILYAGHAMLSDIILPVLALSGTDTLVVCLYLHLNKPHEDPYEDVLDVNMFSQNEMKKTFDIQTATGCKYKTIRIAKRNSTETYDLFFENNKLTNIVKVHG